jgi:hypothetical protein
MTTKIFEDYLTQLDRKLGARNRKILLFIDQCAAHPKNTTFVNLIKNTNLSNSATLCFSVDSSRNLFWNCSFFLER